MHLKANALYSVMYNRRKLQANSTFLVQKNQQIYYSGSQGAETPKIGIRYFPFYTESELIIDRLKEYGFKVTNAAMLKNRIIAICYFI